MEINCVLGINLSLRVKRQFLSPGNDDLFVRFPEESCLKTQILDQGEECAAVC